MSYDGRRPRVGYDALIQEVLAAPFDGPFDGWDFAVFDVHRYGDRLRALHDNMERGRSLRATARRFALVARRTG
ncbi:hypothetical protein [Nonomuraea sp. KM88]|uniref:hypothetical protein n=1 Tax=Nonomuraea sp. KM88 TaxID=3457427 RepID=UPI003FCCA3AF